MSSSLQSEPAVLFNAALVRSVLDAAPFTVVMRMLGASDAVHNGFVSREVSNETFWHRMALRDSLINADDDHTGENETPAEVAAAGRGRWKRAAALRARDLAEARAPVAVRWLRIYLDLQFNRDVEKLVRRSLTRMVPESRARMSLQLPPLDFTYDMIARRWIDYARYDSIELPSYVSSHTRPFTVALSDFGEVAYEDLSKPCTVGRVLASLRMIRPQISERPRTNLATMASYDPDTNVLHTYISGQPFLAHIFDGLYHNFVDERAWVPTDQYARLAVGLNATAETRLHTFEW